MKKIKNYYYVQAKTKKEAAQKLHKRHASFSYTSGRVVEKSKFSKLKWYSFKTLK